MEWKKTSLGLIAVAGLTAGSALGATVIYEGFDYGATLSDGNNINGANGGTGFTGAWVNTRNSPDWVTPGSTAGDLAVVGGRVRGNAWSGIARPIGSTLADANLLDDGATLWFSVIFDLTGANTSNADLNFALTNAAKFDSGAFGNRENLDGAANEGIGITHSGGNIQAVLWDSAGGRTESGASSLTINGTGGNPSSALIVGKIDWGVGTGDETVTLYNPDSSLNLGAPILPATPFSAVDQSGFNNLALQFKDSPWMDEIRFGGSAADVLVPEPTSLALLALGGFMMARRRR